jgi:ribosomal protein L7Ae-like RNA K-turn-binding protein
MIYSTIRPKYAKVKELKAMPQEIIELAEEVGRQEKITVTHVMCSQNNVVYAYGDNEAELQQLGTAFEAIIQTMSV